MAFMTSDMEMETSSEGGIFKGLGRVLSGDTMFLNYFTAKSDNQKIVFSAHSPGKIMAIELDGNTSLIGQKNASLKSFRGGPVNDETMDFWDYPLADISAEIILYRYRYSLLLSANLGKVAGG